MRTAVRSFAVAIVLTGLLPMLGWAGGLTEIGSTKPSDPGIIFWPGGNQLVGPFRFALDDSAELIIIDHRGQVFPFFVPEPATPTSIVRKKSIWSTLNQNEAARQSLIMTTNYTRLIESRDSILTAEGYSANQRVDMLVDFLKQFPDDIVNPHRLAETILSWQYRGVSYKSSKTLSDDSVSRPNRTTMQRQRATDLLEVLRKDCAVFIGWNGAYSVRPLKSGAASKQAVTEYTDLPEHVANAAQSPLTVAQLQKLARR